MGIRYRSAGVMDIGRRGCKPSKKSKPQEDAIVLESSLNLFAIADGIGGCPAGDLASALALKVVVDCLQAEKEACNDTWSLDEERSFADGSEFAQYFSHLLQTANAQVANESMRDESLHGMGSTLVMARLYGDRLFVGNVGDSRAYLMRGEQLTPLTTDQTVGNYRPRLIASGHGSSVALAHEEMLVQWIGQPDELSPAISFIQLKRHDVLLLCSDGLTQMLWDKEIAQLIASSSTPTEMCRKLVDAANEAESLDNISVIVVVFDGDDLNESMTDDVDVFKCAEF